MTVKVNIILTITDETTKEVLHSFSGAYLQTEREDYTLGLYSAFIALIRALKGEQCQQDLPSPTT